MKALAITDHGNMFGAVALPRRLPRHGIKPILGCEIYVATGSRFDKSAAGITEAYNHLTLLAARRRGLPQPGASSSRPATSRASTTGRASTRSCSRSTPRGSSASPAASPARSARPCATAHEAAALAAVGEFSEIFGKDRFYLELMDHGLEEQRRVNPGARCACARNRACPSWPPTTRHYLLPRRPPRPRRAALHRHGQEGAGRRAAALRHPGVLPEERRRRWRALFPDHPEASPTRCEIAEMCDFKLEGASLPARLRRCRRASRSTATSRRSRATASRSGASALEPAGRGGPAPLPARPTTRSGSTRRSGSSGAWASPATS